MRLLVVLALTAVLCEPAFADADGWAEPPDVWPIEEAEKAISDLVGQEFFRKTFVFLPEESRADLEAPDCADCGEVMARPHLVLAWAFRLAEKPFVDERVTALVDMKGSVLLPPDAMPDCKADPAACASFLEEAEALRIARFERLAAGLEPWRVEFLFHGGLKRFVWVVSSVTERGENDSEEGIQITIDAVTGEIVGRGRSFATS